MKRRFVASPGCRLHIFVLPGTKFSDLTGKDRLTRSRLSYTKLPEVPGRRSYEDRGCRAPGLNEDKYKAALATNGCRFDKAQINWVMTIIILFILVIYVTLVYAPIAAFLVELFPTRIRYTSMSFPYHIGNGWFGGCRCSRPRSWPIGHLRGPPVPDHRGDRRLRHRAGVPAGDEGRRHREHQDPESRRRPRGAPAPSRVPDFPRSFPASRGFRERIDSFDSSAGSGAGQHMPRKRGNDGSIRGRLSLELDAPEEFWRARQISWSKKWIACSTTDVRRSAAGCRREPTLLERARSPRESGGAMSALIWDSPVTATARTFTYRELRDRGRFAGALRGWDRERRRGDPVCR
jgi:hypothetical protein